jgi:hypothetical protein
MENYSEMDLKHGQSCAISTLLVISSVGASENITFMFSFSTRLSEWEFFLIQLLAMTLSQKGDTMMKTTLLEHGNFYPFTFSI